MIETTCWGMEAVEAPILRSQFDGRSRDTTISQMLYVVVFSVPQ